MDAHGEGASLELERRERRSRALTTRLVVAVSAFAFLTLVTYLVAHPRMFTGFAAGDDEGYMLTALKSFLHHGSLYDDVYSQYGPFYYEVWGGVFSIVGVTHDAGRMATVVAWVSASLVMGLATARLTSSVLLGLAAQMLTFAALDSLVNESMHPGGLICLLLATILAVASLVGDRPAPGAMAALGAGVAALILIKVNVGLFALAALGLVCVVSYPVLNRREWVRVLFEAGFVVLPLLVMTSKLGEEWARHYAAHVAIAAFAVVLILRTRRIPQRPMEELSWMLGGFLLTTVVVCLGIVVVGTSPGGLVDGVVVQPLHLADAFSLPFMLSGQAYWLDLVSLVGVVGYWYMFYRADWRDHTRLLGLVSLVSILIGLEMALSVIGEGWLFGSSEALTDAAPLDLLAFCWVGLLPIAGREAERLPFAWLLLPPLAVLQALHAYPVAANQIVWGALLQIPLAAVCVINGLRGLGSVTAVSPQRGMLRLGGVVAALALFFFVANTTLREPLREADAEYDAAVPLALPGAAQMRLTPHDAAFYQDITATIADRCGSFQTLPGMDSFYLWTDQEPPTGFNATAWPVLLDDATQRRAVRETRGIPDMCLLRHQGLARPWVEGSPGPLLRYLRRNFHLVFDFGGYQLLMPRAMAGASS